MYKKKLIIIFCVALLYCWVEDNASDLQSQKPYSDLAKQAPIILRGEFQCVENANNGDVFGHFRISDVIKNQTTIELSRGSDVVAAYHNAPPDPYQEGAKVPTSIELLIFREDLKALEQTNQFSLKEFFSISSEEPKLQKLRFIPINQEACQ
jgi:hypothetical protein